MPSRKPTTAGRYACPPLASAISMAGMSSDQTEAAIITPEAKPSSAFCTFAPICFLKKNTVAEPSTVPASGSSRPSRTLAVSPIKAPATAGYARALSARC